MTNGFGNDPPGSQLPQTTELAEGELIAGKYRVDRVLGVGGMGVVVAATHLDLERSVAIKMIRRELANDESAISRFMLEARSAARINSEHVCQVLDVGRRGSGEPYIIMELLLGEDLARALDEHGPIKREDSVDWLLQACEGVAEAHAANIVHRDLKPENLFITCRSDGSVCVKVLDFGISKRLGPALDGGLTGPRVVLGSPRYMAPEQILSGEVDERSDIWALGAILYEMLSGVPAFGGEEVGMICTQVLGEGPTPLRKRAPELPEELERVVLRCLKRERKERFRDVAALATALAPFGSERGRVSSARIVANASRTLLDRDKRLSRPPATPPHPSPPASEAPLEPVLGKHPLGARVRLRWLLPLLGVTLAVAALWLTRGARHESPTRSEAAAPLPASPEAPAAVTPAERVGADLAEAARQAPEPAVENVLSAGPRPPSSQGQVSDGARPRPPGGVPATQASPRQRAAQLPTGHAPASSDTPSSGEERRKGSHAPGQEAWDVENFGGRR